MNFYEKAIEIPAERESCFKRKYFLSAIEKYGLEYIVIEFFREWEEVNFGTEEIKNLADVIRWCDNSLDILDGVYDTLEFNLNNGKSYLLSEIWTTENQIPMLTAHVIPEGKEYGEWMEDDWMDEYQMVYIRLD